ncbi:hypothetical protein [Streptomyces sp. NPDC014734]|uniref:hypothetical protein n=1 Tax=Streptomyces sp. NPDC014734 TaxID=3364886 RepID=UPI0036F97EB0
MSTRTGEFEHAAHTQRCETCRACLKRIRSDLPALRGTLGRRDGNPIVAHWHAGYVAEVDRRCMAHTGLTGHDIFARRFTDVALVLRVAE